MDKPAQYYAIRKPAGATHIRNVYSAAERKLLNGCWHLAERHQFRQIEYEMSIQDLCTYLGIERVRNKDWLKNIIVGLNSKTVQWNAFGKDRSREWGTCVFLQHGIIRGNKFFYRISDKFMSWAKDPRVFTRLRLAFAVRVTSKHAIALAEFLATEMDTSGEPNAREFYFDVSLEDVKILLNLSTDQYSRYSNFRQHVLLPAVSEISEHGDMVVTFDCIKRKRKVVGITFHVIRKDMKQLSLDMPDLNLDEAAEMETTLIAAPSETADELLQLLSDCEIGKVKSARMLDDYSHEQLQRNIAYALEYNMRGNVDKLSGLVIRAVESDYASDWSLVKVNEVLIRWREHSSRVMTEKKQKELEAREKALKKAYKSFLDERRDEYLKSRGETWVMDMKHAFEDSMTGFVRDQFHKEQWDSAVVKVAFNEYLDKQLMKRPEEKSFKAFMIFRGHGLDDVDPANVIDQVAE